jgi:hypothetical protein
MDKGCDARSLCARKATPESKMSRFRDFYRGAIANFFVTFYVSAADDVLS